MGGFSINLYVTRESNIFYLEKLGYTIVTLGEVLKKGWGYKTNKEISDKLKICIGTLSRRLAYTKENEKEFLEELHKFIEKLETGEYYYRYSSGKYGVNSMYSSGGGWGEYSGLHGFLIEEVLREILYKEMNNKLNITE